MWSQKTQQIHLCSPWFLNCPNEKDKLTIQNKNISRWWSWSQSLGSTSSSSQCGLSKDLPSSTHTRWVLMKINDQARNVCEPSKSFSLHFFMHWGRQYKKSIAIETLIMLMFSLSFFSHDYLLRVGQWSMMILVFHNWISMYYQRRVEQQTCKRLSAATRGRHLYVYKLLCLAYWCVYISYTKDVKVIHNVALWEQRMLFDLNRCT